MFNVVTIFILTFVLVLFLKFVSMLISEDQLLSREEASSYECGFESRGGSRVPFSLRYYLVTLVFLLFDLEVVFLFLFPTFIFNFSVVFSVVSLVLVLLFLVFGLIYEWLDGSLDWVS